ncbi:hypothetical protein [Rheinheimera baltica]|uniref:hypothetical protein n=1 Tax=Rheinheimera baltica TaxID=67576 RepID=UPI0003FD71F6|nr:hypothetical protein [Rheinheimera baltica]
MKNTLLRKLGALLTSFKIAKSKNSLVCYIVLSAAMAIMTPNLYAAAFVDDMTNSGENADSLNRTLSSTSFTYTFTNDGDGPAAGGGLAFDAFGAGGTAGMTLLSSTFNTGTTERVTIRRTDLADFVFTSIYIDNPGGNQNVTVGGYLDGALVGSTQNFATGTTTLNFGSILVDEVRLTSTDFFGLAIDNFTGNTTPPDSTPPTITSVNSSTANDT